MFYTQSKEGNAEEGFAEDRDFFGLSQEQRS